VRGGGGIQGPSGPRGEAKRPASRCVRNAPRTRTHAPRTRTHAEGRRLGLGAGLEKPRVQREVLPVATQHPARAAWSCLVAVACVAGYQSFRSGVSMRARSGPTTVLLLLLPSLRLSFADIFLHVDCDWAQLSEADKPGFFDMCTPVEKLLIMYGVEESYRTRMLNGTAALCIPDEDIDQNGRMMMLKHTDPVRHAQYIEAKGLTEVMAWLRDTHDQLHEAFNATRDWVREEAIPIAARSAQKLQVLAYDLASEGLSLAEYTFKLLSRLAEKLTAFAIDCVMTPPCRSMMLSAAAWAIDQFCKGAKGNVAAGCLFVQSLLPSMKERAGPDPSADPQGHEERAKNKESAGRQNHEERANKMSSDAFESEHLPPFAESGRRYALVMGITDYPEAPLRKTVNDARSVGEALEHRGFKVEYSTNAKKKDFTQQIRRYAGILKDGDVFFYYFSGHGSQRGGHHKLETVDGRSIDLERELIRPVNEVGARTLNIVMMDACRANNAEKTWKSSPQEPPMTAKASKQTWVDPDLQVDPDLPSDRHGKEWLLSFSSDPGTVSIEYYVDDYSKQARS
jgi:hypothetical protein